jgi:peptidoglycan/xylan/chitin deacetylase (PgdA/CDA1 family)
MLLRPPPAVMYWLGVGQTRAMEQGENAILLCHGTPLRSAAPLERQLRYLRRVFTLVPFAEPAASTGAARAPARRRQAAIIFDDGLRSNVRVAYPMLRALGIPATFVVCPDSSRSGAGSGPTRRVAACSSPDRSCDTSSRASSARRPRSRKDREAFLARWDELRLLDPSIVTVGSHSMTHPVLSSMSAGESRPNWPRAVA